MLKLLFFELCFLWYFLGILEPQIYVVVEHFGAENISLLSGRLVLVLPALCIIYKKLSFNFDLLFRSTTPKKHRQGLHQDHERWKMN